MGVGDELASIVAGRELAPSPRDVVLPADDDEADLVGHDGIAVDGSTFFIEYRDSAGFVSARRITVSQVYSGPDGSPSVMAYCHERRAPRSFRVDRIICCIDFDGVVYGDARAFLAMGLGVVVPSSHMPASPARWSAMLDIARDEAAILSSISRSDGILKPVETNAMLDYLLWRIEREGIYPSDSEAENLKRYLERLRPGPDAIDRAVRRLGNLDHNTLARLFRACVAVMDADGIRRREEKALIDTLSLELTGISLF